MRISDWSSDVCSSDLHVEHLGGKPPGRVHAGKAVRPMKLDRAARDFGVFRRLYDGVTGHKCAYSNAGSFLRAKSRFRESWRVSERIWTAGLVVIGDEILSGGTQRSEEHTSELQSLMRISY